MSSGITFIGLLVHDTLPHLQMSWRAVFLERGSTYNTYFKLSEININQWSKIKKIPQICYEL